jgi:hypothetical protein
MKRFVLITLFAVFAFNSFAWNKLGHAVAVAVAQRHLTDVARMNAVIFEIDHTQSQDLVNTQLRNAGYRLAYLLNLYFGE